MCVAIGRGLPVGALGRVADQRDCGVDEEVQPVVVSSTEDCPPPDPPLLLTAASLVAPGS